MGGGIMDASCQESIGGGDYKVLIWDLVVSLKKAVKKTVKKGEKNIASSDIGKAALIGAAAFGIPGTSIGGIFGRASFWWRAPGKFGFGVIGNAYQVRFKFL